MNERIKELAKQADTYALNMNPEQDSYGRPANSKKVQQDRDAKFAELIVRECVSVIQEELDSGQYSQPVHTGFRVSKNMIKEHFGVEE